MKAIIAPSLLSCNLGNIIEESQRILSLGADWLHIDVMDGHFVPNLTLGPPVVKSMRQFLPDAYFDCHLMVTDPAQWVRPFAEAGASSLTVHIETLGDFGQLSALLNEIKAAQVKASVAIKPSTDTPEHLKEAIRAGLVDMVLVMTVEPGFGGQAFMSETMPKLLSLRKEFPELNIQVDGGITVETIGQAAENGANVVVSGTGVFKHANPQEAIRMLREAVDKPRSN